ncbi:hypothetical protein [Serratia proteamaculans]|uniref:Uncharacterized protein n=1 Tax=Serratia proteamaculans TaxID=28151 RepID=A0A5Q2VCW7_SERPR|nr:hypothetical protein [Serratia proteamaculans]QGH63407.1 hypothetical protein GHV41_22310 [Serratia proteamaculans]
MSKKVKIDKKFTDALTELNSIGECPVNYCLSYVRGFMQANGKAEYLHEWDDACMRVGLTIGEQIH